MPASGQSIDLTASPAVTPSPGNVEAALVRLEGKLDRVIDGMARQTDDMRLVRDRLHDHANQLTAITTLNLPEKLAAIHDELKDHDHRLGACENDIQQRKGAAVLARALWAVVCLFGLGGIAALVRIIAGH